MKFWLKSKTILSSIFFGLLGIVGAYSDQLEVMFGPKALAHILVIAAIVGVVLRSVTTQPITIKPNANG
jgi:DMSO reductase anchor subunit